MKKVLLLLVLAIIGVALWYFFVTRPKPDNEAPRQQPLAVSKHSAGFNLSVNKALNDYYGLTESFVNWDSNAVKGGATILKAHLDSVNFDELKKDSTIYQTATSYLDMFKSDLATIAADGDLASKRVALNGLSQNMYDLLRIVKYDDQKVYLQQCPMAFNETDPGIWLSKSEDIRNPYLGLHHPKYKGGMVTCGETKDSLNFKQ